MSVNSVQNFRTSSMNSYQPKFKGKPVEEIDCGDYIEKHVETKASTGKKWGVGIASVIPGLGQFINGDVGKGFAYLGVSVAACVARTLGDLKGKLGVALAARAVYLVAVIGSIVDAVKNAKSEAVQIVPKE